MRVQLYRNLKSQYRKQRAWSLKALSGPHKGTVYDVVSGAVLQDAQFVVNETGRQYVIKKQAKFVHAWVEGELIKTYKLNALPVDADGDDIAPGMGVRTRVGYNPFKYKHMVREDCGEYVEDAPLVVATPMGVYAHFDEPCRGRGLRGLDGIDPAWAPADVDGWNG